MNSSVSRIQQSLSPVVTGLGYELLGIEWHGQGKHSLLRIYIDHENGIGIEDCETVSRQLSAYLDVEDLIPGHYRLEVSSPGLDRPLFSLDQFSRFIGEDVKIKCLGAINGQKRFEGSIEAVMPDSGEIVIALADESTLSIPFSNIAKANLVAKF